MKYCKPTKSNEPHKILRMIAREDELERNNGKWNAMNRAFKNKKKYDRKQNKKDLGNLLKSLSFLFKAYSFSLMLRLRFLLLFASTVPRSMT